MSKSFVLIMLLVVSLGTGILLGEWFFHLFLKAVPPVALSNFNTQASRIAHWLYGAGVGVVLFVWALIGMAAGRIMHMASKSEPKA